MLRYIVVLITVSILAKAKHVSKRKDPIAGETYFGSEQLLKTEIDDVKPFIAELTLPKSGLEVTGNTEELYEQFERHNKKNVTYRELVINWICLNSHDNALEHQVLDLNRFDGINRIEELWVAIDTGHEWKHFSLLGDYSVTGHNMVQTLAKMKSFCYFRNFWFITL